MDKTPVYKESFEYACQHGEQDQHIASNRANITCRDAIQKAIVDHASYNTFDAASAVRDVVKQFGYERMSYVLANTVQTMDSDGRVSQSNKKWAQTIPVAFERGKRDYSYYITRIHPGILNMFVSEAQHEFLLKQPLKAEDIKAEASHILKQFQEAPEPNSPHGTHFMARVSSDFWARAKPKDHDRLMNMLPFASLSLSTLDGHKGIYALITKDEDRSRPLVLRRPSVRKKLQEPNEPSKASAPAKIREPER